MQNSSLDWVFCSMFFHDLPYVVPTLKAMKRVAKPEAYISIIEVEGYSKFVDNLDFHGHALISMFNLFHCMPLSWVLLGEWNKPVRRIKSMGLN